jgi:hypothetical protein
MKTIRSAGVAIAIGGAFLLAFVALNPSRAQVGAGPATKWEYKTIEGFASDYTLNVAGNEGWELCGILGPVHTPTISTPAKYVFKRPKR